MSLLAPVLQKLMEQGLEQQRQMLALIDRIDQHLERLLDHLAQSEDVMRRALVASPMSAEQAERIARGYQTLARQFDDVEQMREQAESMRRRAQWWLQHADQLKGDGR